MGKNNRRGLVETPSPDVLGPLQDIIRQLREGGLTKEHLQALSDHRNPFEKKEAVQVTSFKHDKTKDGWTLLEDAPFDDKLFIPDVVEFLKSGESSVNGEVMKQRAKELNAHLGQRHAEYLMDHQELIPKRWRGKYYLAFPGTIWRDSDSCRRVPFLYRLDGRWCLHFSWLRSGWDSRNRLLRSRE